LYGVLLLCVGAVAYLTGVLLFLPRFLLGLDEVLRPVAAWLVWYSGVPVVLGFLFVLADLLLFYDHKRPHRDYRCDSPRDPRVVVALTAYNDEESVEAAVTDFATHPSVSGVIVVSNNSTDATFDVARAAGAVAVNESRPGYGRCVYRCLSEALDHGAADFIVLCEGDRTFRAADIDKFLAYAPHVDIVNGTRIVEALCASNTQLTTFMFYGNLFVAKLLEAKYLGRSTLTDVGTTYKLIRAKALRRVLPRLNPSINLEFNAHFLDTALSEDCVLMECPITFHQRVGASKGGNRDNWSALKVGAKMMRGIILGWPGAR